MSVEHKKDGITEAVLAVETASIEDSGNYTCSPANSKPAHVQIFVNKGNDMPFKSVKILS